MMKNSIIIFMLMTFVVSCNQKEKKSSSETQKEVQKKSLNLEKKKPEKKEVVKMDKPFVKVQDTIPPKKTKRTLEKYKANLERLNDKLSNKDYTWEEIQVIIPLTDDEFGAYYDFSYSGDIDSSFFEKIDFTIFKYAKWDKGDIFFLTLDVAQFVDGEYAESYFSAIEESIMSNKKKLCAMYKYLSKNSKRRLEYLYNEVCHGIERPEEYR